ncbi:MAG: polysaccharide biosynthesis protein, partial [Alphaproteobacteria bacterium]
GSSEMRVMGFLDDDERLHGQLMMGQPVYSPAEIEALVEKHELTDVLLAIPSASRKRRTQILELIRPLGVAIRTVPGVDDVARGRVRTSDLRELDIDDLLGREAVAPDESLLDRNIRGKTVLVSGAGGSIGSELCRQILGCAPTALLLVDCSEPALYSIHHELDARARQTEEKVALVPLLASVLDEARIRSILSAWKPDTIYHAAAYKHVPLVEHNPIEGVRNNVFGTLALAQLASEAEVSDFVLISTDKAVRPTNVMGTTKRLAEQILQAISQTSQSTHYSMVRFGNVLGSSGSVVPLFRKQIAAGGPITITHPEITRYFMTIPEAAQLVIQAGAMGKGGEVFVLDMGEPVKIVDLARMMVELSGLTLTEADKGEGDIELSFVGLRPGEKLYEELLIGNSPEATSHPRIMRANEHFLPWGELRLRLDEMQAAMDRGDVAAVVDLLKIVVPEYTPDQHLVDWVHMKGAARR